MRRDSLMKLSSISGSFGLRGAARRCAAGAAGRTGRRPGQSSRPSSAGVVAGVVHALRPAAPQRRHAGARQVVGMDVVGVHVVSAPAPACREQARARRAAFAVGRIDAGNAQDAGAHARCRAWPAKVAHQASASTRRRARRWPLGFTARVSSPRRRRSRRTRRWWSHTPAPPARCAGAAPAAALGARVATSPCRAAAPGAARVARPARRCRWRGRPGCRPAARCPGRAAAVPRRAGASASTRSARRQCAPRAGRRRRSRRSAARAGAGSAPAGAEGFWFAGKIASFRSARSPEDTPMTHTITVQPSGRSFTPTGRGHPHRRHPPGHRPALRLQGRRLRLVQVQEARGHRGARHAPGQGAERRRRSRRLRADLLRRGADRRGAGVAPGHRRKRLSHQEDAGARGARWSACRTT
jgi:hypothetical protein